MSNEKDTSYFLRNEKGEPVAFVEHHTSHQHNGKLDHYHKVDLTKATIADICKGGKYNQLREDYDPD